MTGEHTLGECSYRIEVAEITRLGLHPPAARASELRCDLAATHRRASGDHHACPGAGQRRGGRPAQPGRAPVSSTTDRR
ncbi:MAG: hypothetical protein R2713_14380 [Ilumatobacteraceae bacterium]